MRSKRGKLSFERQPDSAASPSASSRSSDSTPPPPPPAPPLPLTGLSWSNRDVLADDETVRIRPLTFKRPLTDWGFTNNAGRGATSEDAGAVVVAGQGDGGVTVKSTGSDASSSGVESGGGSTRRAPRGDGVAAVPGSTSVITNYAYCGNAAAGGAVNTGLVIDVDEYADRTCTSPADFVFGKNYGQHSGGRTVVQQLHYLRYFLLFSASYYLHYRCWMAR